MVEINTKLTQTYQTQVKKVAAQEENNQQQTQQAETQAVKQPAVPTLQQPTVKVPLENLQLIAGVNVGNNTNLPKASKLAHIVSSMTELKERINDPTMTFDIGESIYISAGDGKGYEFRVRGIIYDENGNRVNLDLVPVLP